MRLVQLVQREGPMQIPGIEVFPHRVGHMVSEDWCSLLFPMFVIKIFVPECFPF